MNERKKKKNFENSIEIYRYTFRNTLPKSWRKRMISRSRTRLDPSKRWMKLKRKGGRGTIEPSSLRVESSLGIEKQGGCTPQTCRAISGPSFVPRLLSLSLFQRNARPPPWRAHPSLQPVSSATAALSATSEPGCFAIII